MHCKYRNLAIFYHAKKLDWFNPLRDEGKKHPLRSKVKSLLFQSVPVCVRGHHERVQVGEGQTDARVYVNGNLTSTTTSCTWIRQQLWVYAHNRILSDYFCNKDCYTWNKLILKMGTQVIIFYITNSQMNDYRMPHQFCFASQILMKSFYLPNYQPTFWKKCNKPTHACCKHAMISCYFFWYFVNIKIVAKNVDKIQDCAF